MKIAIVGAGSIALASAALLVRDSHDVMLWSPSGRCHLSSASDLHLPKTVIDATGTVEGTFPVAYAQSARQLVEWGELIFFCLPAYGHKATMDAIAPYINRHHRIIISSHASFGALYLSRLLSVRSLANPIIVWGTTLVTGRSHDMDKVHINTIRAKIDMATVPHTNSGDGFALCEQLFGKRFVNRNSLMAIALSNLNPQNHFGIALGNMSRMERGEDWNQGQNVTPNIGRLLEALDAERLAIASALELDVRTIFEHFHLSFHVPPASVAEMNQQMFREGKGGKGPASAHSRYVLEDVPFGLVPTFHISLLTGVDAPLHKAGIDIFSALYGRDFYQENDLLSAIDMDSMSLARLQDLCRLGWFDAE